MATSACNMWPAYLTDDGVLVIVIYPGVTLDCVRGEVSQGTPCGGDAAAVRGVHEALRWLVRYWRPQLTVLSRWGNGFTDPGSQIAGGPLVVAARN
jgi:hypothetical protein